MTFWHAIAFECLNLLVKQTWLLNSIRKRIHSITKVADLKESTGLEKPSNLWKWIYHAICEGIYDIFLYDFWKPSGTITVPNTSLIVSAKTNKGTADNCRHSTRASVS